MIDSLKPYQTDIKKIIFFFEGKTLHKPGKKAMSLPAIKKWASGLSKSLRVIYLGRKYKGKRNKLAAAKKRLARLVRRADWWFDVLLSERLISMQIF